MSFNNSSSSIDSNVTCSEKTSNDGNMVEIYFAISWWFEYFLQTGIGIAGLIANTLAIPILLSREMNSIFNKLLIFLAVFDNLYIICSMLEGRRKHNEEFDQLHEYAFGYGLYPLHNFVLCCSIYITVALALERYRAVWRPVEYHNKCKGVNPWRRVVLSYVMPVIIFSVLFNIPKFFEVKFVFAPMEVVTKLEGVEYENDTEGEHNHTTVTTINRTLASPTGLRLQDHYVIFYVNAARLLVQGIIPFISLSLLNYRIYWVIKRRRQLVNRPPQQLQQPSVNNNTGNRTETFSSAQRKANEAQQAIVLFMIVLLFFICHTPRFIINIHEFLTLEALRQSIEHDCDGVSYWAMCFASVSHCLMTLNSSVNFFIYGFMCSTFRQVLFRWFKRLTVCFRRRSLSTSSSPTTADVSRYMPPQDELVTYAGSVANFNPETPSERNGTHISGNKGSDENGVNPRMIMEGEDTRPLVHFQISDAEISKHCDVVTSSNGRLANREAAEMLKKKKAKRDSITHPHIKIEIRSPTYEAATTDDADTISEALSDNTKFLETSL